MVARQQKKVRRTKKGFGGSIGKKKQADREGREVQVRANVLKTRTNGRNAKGAIHEKGEGRNFYKQSTGKLLLKGVKDSKIAGGGKGLEGLL